MQHEAAAPVAAGPVDAGADQRLAHATALGSRGHGEHPETCGVPVVPLGVLVAGACHIGDRTLDLASTVHGHQHLGYLGPVPGIPQVSLVVGLGVVARQRPVGSEHKLANSVIFARTGWAYPHLRITIGVGGRGQGRAPAGPGAVATPVCQARLAYALMR